MDIQKEWDSFVEYLRTKGVVKIGRNALGVITNLVREGSCSLSYNDIELMWETWQDKAQERAKLKLLLCDKHLEKCESPTGIFNSQYPEEEPCLICLAKEAKAQAVPECTWSHDSDEDMYSTWHTKCGNAFVLNEDGPTENQMNYCCYCGGKLVEAQEPAND